MLKSKVFVKKTKRGRIIKIVREHYLRDDIWCGSAVCEECDQEETMLQSSAGSPHTTCTGNYYLIPDTNVVLHQMDILEDKSVTNVIILQTVLEEVKHRSAPAYKRLKDAISTPQKHFYAFVNEFHKDTYIERQPKESANDRNDRAIRVAAAWYRDHLHHGSEKVDVVLLTNDAQNRQKAVDEKLTALTVKEYVEKLENGKDLLDKVALSEDYHKEFATGKALYPEHLSLSDIQRGLKSGKYLQGTFMASRDNYLEGHVSVQDSENMIFIQGLQNINRAVHQDLVAIEILPQNDWSMPSSMVLVDEEEHGEETVSQEEKLVKDKVKKNDRQKSAKVIGIIKRNWRPYCGMLQKSLIKGATRHLFMAAERRIPKIRIETRQAEELANKRIIVAIDSWPRHSRYPLGHFLRDLGAVGDKVTENEVLLLEHDVPHSPFSAAVLKCLPQLPWLITDEDLKKRVDLRGTCICSVDPPGCTDIDDALHARVLDNGNYEVGVHIADVSHFIRPGTAIDKEAASRGTTVYLIDKRIDMVPELLSSNLCSLRGNEERFAFSVLWEMTPEAEIVSSKYTKSVICSWAALTYAEAQLRIDDKSQNDEVTQGLRRLNSLAKILKRRRIEKGALSLASSEVRFHIDSETHDPIDVQTKELRDTNSMVEEFMLLANISVAQKICDEFPDAAVLRRHPAPPASNFDPLIVAAQSKGFEIDVNSGKAFADSLDKAVVPENPFFNVMLRILATRCMMQAVYFCSGMVPPEDYQHYGLAMPIYTHFTSPIRRYSDVLVHRLLAVCVSADASYPDLLDKRKTQSVCNNLNYRHKMAQYAGRASVGLHTQIFFRNRVVDEQGYILFVRKNALQVMIPKYGLEGNVFLSDPKKKSDFTYNEQEHTQTIGDTVFHIFDPVTVQISIDQSNVQHQKLCLKLVHPKIPGFSVPAASEDSNEPPRKKLKKL